MLSEYIKNNKGFGLLEIAISISLIAISVIPIVNMLSTSLKEEAKMEQRLTAIYLAQEGMEVIRKIRDDDVNWPPAGMTGGDKVIVSDQSQSFGQCKNTDVTDGFKLLNKTTNRMQVLTKANSGYIQCEYDSAMVEANEWHNSGFQRYVNITDLGGGVMQIIVKVERNGQIMYSLTSYLNDLR